MKEPRCDILGLLKARDKAGQKITAEEFQEALKNSPIRKDDAINQHTQIGNNPIHWEGTARGLFAASNSLKAEQERVRSTVRNGPLPDIAIANWLNIMLTALGIECLVKAIWILQGNQLARDGKYVGMAKNEGPHNLERLCDIARIPLNEQERDALQRMSEFGKSIARYPIGKAAITKPLYWTLKDDDMIEDFVRRLKAQVHRMQYPDFKEP